MPFHLKAHVFAVEIQDDLVLLDTVADRYFCFPEAGSASLSDDRRSLLLMADAAASGLEHLIAPSASPARRPPALPSRGAPSQAAVPSWRTWGWMFGAYVDLATLYPGRSFEHILRAAGRLRDGRPADLAADAGELAAVFSRLAVWTPISRKCLIRSLLLLLFLTRAGAKANWVFGVRTWPFGAHCWLQAGEVCLDDEPERLAGYHPILVV